MKVQLQTTVDVDTDVTVSVEDITFALQERLEKAKEDPESQFALNCFVNCVYQCVLAMDDAFVLRMNPKHRKTIGETLGKLSINFRDRTG